MRGAGQVNDPEGKLWAPARWVVAMIQYLIALIMVTMGEGIKAIFTGNNSRKRHQEKTA